MGEKPHEISYTQRGYVSPVCTMRFEGGAAGSLRCGAVWGWRKAGSVYHTVSHAQCYWHISPDSYDELRRLMQKIVSFLPTPLHLKQIFILVTSSSCSWYLPSLLSSILHVCIPLVFPLSLPSFLHPSLCFYHLTMGVLVPLKDKAKNGKKGNETHKCNIWFETVWHLLLGERK